MTRYYWTGISSDDRIAGISRIQDCINKYGAIVDHKLYSDISMSLVIEIESDRITALHENLRHIIDLSTHNELPVVSKSESVILLNITFTKGSGDMKIEVPSVPG